MSTFFYNYILINVARTWERIRVAQPNQEMPLDNIESAGVIVEIADKIYKSPTMEEFWKAMAKGEARDWFNENLGMMSDVWIESEATKIIKAEYL